MYPNSCHELSLNDEQSSLVMRVDNIEYKSGSRPMAMSTLVKRIKRSALRIAKRINPFLPRAPRAKSHISSYCCSSGSLVSRFSPE